MLDKVLGSVHDLLSLLGISTWTLTFVTICTAVLSVWMLTGQTARIGVWFEDVLYRFGLWRG